jgi:hypothetical protein
MGPGFGCGHAPVFGCGQPPGFGCCHPPVFGGGHAPGPGGGHAPAFDWSTVVGIAELLSVMSQPSGRRCEGTDRNGALTVDVGLVPLGTLPLLNRVGETVFAICYLTAIGALS